MDFSTDLINLMPKKFRDGPEGPWTVLFEKFGEILNDVHTKIEGLADLNDRDRVPDDYMNYLAEHYGIQLVIGPATEDAARRRMFLKSIFNLIKSKGQTQVILDVAYFIYLIAFSGVDVTAYDLWTTDYQTFTTSGGNLYETPYDWMGDGVTTQFDTILSYIPVRRRSVKIVTIAEDDDSVLEAKDDGNGGLIGDVESIGSIDYETGDINLTFSKAPKFGANITVYWIIEIGQYLSPHLMLAFTSNVFLKMGADELTVYPAGWVGDDIQDTFTTTLNNPITAGTVRITALSATDATMVITDDGAGNLIGAVGSGNNTIDYDTGDVDVTFEEPVKLDELIKVEYTHENLFLGKERFSRMMTILDRWRPAHVVLRTEIGVSTEFWRVGVQHSRVGGAGSPAPTESEQIRIGGTIWPS